jgi:hypothetical protein
MEVKEKQETSEREREITIVYQMLVLDERLLPKGFLASQQLLLSELPCLFPEKQDLI